MNIPIFFQSIVDEIIRESEQDPELDTGLKWVNKEAKRRGISFYEMIYHVLVENEAERKARDWLKNGKT